jgi:hypothetical protein
MNHLSLIHILSFTALPAGLFLALHFSLRGKTEAAQRKILFIICCFNIVLYVVYKAYQAFYYDGYDFVLVYNLPLHICNLNLILLLPMAVLKRNKTLMAYQVYFGSALAFFALYAIDPAFRGEQFFEFSCMVYYYYHSMLAVMPLLFLSFKMLTPTFKGTWRPSLLLIALTFVMHIVNMVFRATGLAEDANYFFTYGVRGDPFTEAFWRIVPYEFFFLLPAFVILFVPYVFALTLPFHLSARAKSKRSS